MLKKDLISSVISFAAGAIATAAFTFNSASAPPLETTDPHTTVYKSIVTVAGDGCAKARLVPNDDLTADLVLPPDCVSVTKPDSTLKIALPVRRFD